MKKKVKCNFSMENIVEHEGYKWFFEIRENILFKNKSGEAVYEAMIYIPWSSESVSQEYGRIIIANNKVYIIPIIPKPIPVYDISKDKLEFIEYNCENMPRVYQGTTFFDGVVEGEYLYIIPCKYSHILKINIYNDELSYIDISGNNKMSYAWGSIYLNDKSIFFTEIDGNNIYCLDTETNKVTKRSIDINGIGGIIGDEKEYYVIPYNRGSILVHDLNEQKDYYYNSYPTGFEFGEFGNFANIINIGDYIYLLPRTSNMGLVINKIDHSMRDLHISRDMVSDLYYKKYCPYICCIERNGNIYFVTSDNGYCYLENSNSCYFEYGYIQTDRIEEVLKQEMCTNILKEDNNVFSLDLLLHTLK